MSLTTSTQTRADTSKSTSFEEHAIAQLHQDLGFLEGRSFEFQGQVALRAERNAMSLAITPLELFKLSYDERTERWNIEHRETDAAAPGGDASYSNFYLAKMAFRGIVATRCKTIMNGEEISHVLS